MRKFNESQYLKNVKIVHDNFYKYPFGADITNMRRDYITVECPNHGYYKVRADHHKNGIKCRQCSKGNDLGVYTRVSADKNKNEWSAIKSFLYFLEIENDTEIFFKIGVTKNIDKRLKEFPKNYNITVQGLFENSLYTNIMSENDIKEDFKNFKYTPSEKFRGWTECFEANMLNLYYS